MRSSERPTRGVAVLAATFVLTLVGYLFLTAIPAMATEVDCVYTNNLDGVAGNEHIALTLRADFDGAIAVSDGDWPLLGDPGELRTHDSSDDPWDWDELPDGCDAARTNNGSFDWLEIIGSNAGQEKLHFVHPIGNDEETETFENMVTTVNLGSGSDTLFLEFGDYRYDPDFDVLEDPENDDDPAFLTSDGSFGTAPQNGGQQIVDYGQDDIEANAVDGAASPWTFGLADMRIDNAESVVVNTGEGDDRIDGSNDNIEFRAGPVDGDYNGSADDLADADGLFDADIEPDEGDPNGDGDCQGEPSNLTLTGNGGADDDLMESGFGNDTFNGGAGDDEISYKGESVHLQTIGNDDDDPFCDGPGPVTVDLAGPPAAPASGGSTGTYGTDVLNDVQDIQGTPWSDTLLGNDLDNDIFGDDGNDTIDGRGGSDGEGWDTIGIDEGLEGGEGDDSVSGSAGNDQVFGDFEDEGECDDENDSCNDYVNGGLGDDEVDAGPGDDVVDEGAANSGHDDLNGNDGADLLDYGARTTVTAVRAVGGACSGEDLNHDGDACDTGEEQDVVTWDFEGYRTGSANDNLVGDSSGETFDGGLGDDTIDGSIVSGFDDAGDWGCGGGGQCDFYNGLDWVVYSAAPSGIVANMVASTASGTEPGSVTGGGGNDTIVQVEGVVGSNFDDTFNDDPDENNGYIGNDGNDTFNQGSASSRPDNGPEDAIFGGGGTDFMDYSERTTDTEGIMEDENDGCFQDSDNTFPTGTFIVGCDVQGWEFRNGDTENDEEDLWSQDTENIDTGSGDDTIVGNDTANVINTNAGDDRVAGVQGSDTFGGGTGDDYYAGGCPWWWDDVLDCEASPNDGNDVFLTVEPATAAPGDTQGDGADVIFGGSGSDYYDASGRTADQNLTSESFPGGNFGDDCQQQDDGVFGEGDSLCLVENIRGGSGADYIGGDRYTNKLTGGAGDDNLQGRGNRDILRGQAGDDLLYGGNGPDRLQGGPGFDQAWGGPGANVCASIEQWTRCQLG